MANERRTAHEKSEQREVLKAIGIRIAALRAQRGWTREQLAEFAVVDVQALRRAETGRSALPYHRAQRVASALGVSLGDLFTTTPVTLADDPGETLVLTVYRALPPDRRRWAVRVLRALLPDG